MITPFCDQSKWEYWNYKSRNFIIASFKDLTKNAPKLQKDLKQKNTTLKRN